ncbi:hypothetical protein NC981_23090 [Leptolyngbya sp. DQ-M1]
MRYSIMLQLVGFLTLVLLGTAAFFAWMQNRPTTDQNRTALKNFDLVCRA